MKAATQCFICPSSRNPEILFQQDIILDYNITLEERIARSNLEWVHPSINSKNFPCPEMETREVRLALIQFHGFIVNKIALLAIESGGYRAANVEELLTIVRLVPNVVKECAIVAMGSSHHLGTRWSPRLDQIGSKRIMNLEAWKRINSKHCYLIAKGEQRQSRISHA